MKTAFDIAVYVLQSLAVGFLFSFIVFSAFFVFFNIFSPVDWGSYAGWVIGGTCASGVILTAIRHKNDGYDSPFWS